MFVKEKISEPRLFVDGKNMDKFSITNGKEDYLIIDQKGDIIVNSIKAIGRPGLPDDEEIINFESMITGDGDIPPIYKYDFYHLSKDNWSKKYSYTLFIENCSPSRLVVCYHRTHDSSGITIHPNLDRLVHKCYIFHTDFLYAIFSNSRMINKTLNISMQFECLFENRLYNYDLIRSQRTPINIEISWKGNYKKCDRHETRLYHFSGKNTRGRISIDFCKYGLKKWDIVDLVITHKIKGTICFKNVRLAHGDCIYEKRLLSFISCTQNEDSPVYVLPLDLVKIIKSFFI